MKYSDIKNLESEAGVVATVIHNPKFTFHSEDLKPYHFSDEQNAYVYYAVSELARQGVERIDAFNITNILNARESTKNQTKVLTNAVLTELITLSVHIKRNSVDEYRILVKNVLDKAFRRETYKKLASCQNLCFDESESEIEHKIYETLDKVMLDFSTTNEIPEYKNVVEDLWSEIKERQENGFAGMPFKFKTLNEYCTIEPSELIIFAADTKVGKSMLLLNCAADLMRDNVPILYIDSELNSRTFTIRLIAHLTKIEFSRVKFGKYSPEEEVKINKCIAWLKTRKFTHLYLPMFDAQTIYTAVKKVKHTQGLEVLIIDYFKSKGEGDAFNTYQEMGALVDLVKNRICGEMNIAGIGAAQATSTGKIADSARIGRNASSIILLERKTADEIVDDGAECGNTKMRVVLNRNGAQMSSDEYIDLMFNGNLISYEEAVQHTKYEPF